MKLKYTSTIYIPNGRVQHKCACRPMANFNVAANQSRHIRWPSISTGLVVVCNYYYCRRPANGEAGSTIITFYLRRYADWLRRLLAAYTCDKHSSAHVTQHSDSVAAREKLHLHLCNQLAAPFNHKCSPLARKCPLMKQLTPFRNITCITPHQSARRWALKHICIIHICIIVLIMSLLANSQMYSEFDVASSNR